MLEENNTLSIKFRIHYKLIILIEFISHDTGGQIDSLELRLFIETPPSLSGSDYSYHL